MEFWDPSIRWCADFVDMKYIQNGILSNDTPDHSHYDNDEIYTEWNFESFCSSRSWATSAWNIYRMEFWETEAHSISVPLWWNIYRMEFWDQVATQTAFAYKWNIYRMEFWVATLLFLVPSSWNEIYTEWNFEMVMVGYFIWDKQMKYIQNGILRYHRQLLDWKLFYEIYTEWNFEDTVITSVCFPATMKYIQNGILRSSKYSNRNFHRYEIYTEWNFEL